MRHALALVLFSTAIWCSSHTQETWVKLPENPVLQRDTLLAELPNDIYAISDPWVIKEGSIFKMWYTCAGLNFPTDTLLRARICYSESPDGINWTKYNNNPVLDVDYSGGWDSLGVETVSVIRDSEAPANQRYKMWYAGQYLNSYKYDFGYAYSADGLNWTKHPTQVLQTGEGDTWDNGFVEGPSVIKDDNTYKMWYTGYDLGNGKANTGYATSTDGIEWTKYAGNPVINTGAAGTWDAYSVQDPHVLKIGADYHMWYGGLSQDSIYGQQVGYAYSADGISWTKSPANPVLTKGSVGDWDANTASFPAVIMDEGILKMWYTGKDVDPLPQNTMAYFWELGYATDLAQTLGVNSDKAGAGISISPNPFSKRTTLQFDRYLNNATLSVYNNNGQLVEQVKNLSGQSTALSRNNLINGLYFIKVAVSNQTIASGKLIIVD